MRVRVAAAATALLMVAGFFPQTATNAAVPTLKPVITGLLDRKGMPPPEFVPKLDGFVVKVNWSDLQPSAFGPILTQNPIDIAVAAVRAQPAGSRHRLKLRVLAGIYAPDWAKNLGGGPVNVYKGAHIFTVGKFWTAPFRDAYADLQSKLAARYDAKAEIAEVLISRCTIMTAEPFLRADRPDTRTMQSLVDGGYTAAADEVCHREQIDAHRLWTRTRSGLTLDPYDRIRADATSSPDLAFTEQMMGYCRSALGKRCVLESDGIASPLLPDPYPAMYAAIAAYGPPIAYQTRNPERIGDWYQALTWSAQQGANHVELNFSYPSYDPIQLESVRRQLKANPTTGTADRQSRKQAER